MAAGMPKVCSALPPALLPLVIAFRCLEPNGHTGPQVTVMAGWLRLTTVAARVFQPQVFCNSTAPRKLCLQVSTRGYTRSHISAISHFDFGIPQQVAANNLSGRTTAIFINGAVQNFRPRSTCVTCR